VTGADFTVYEGDTSPEGYNCYAGSTIDGPWIFLGTGSGTTQFDLAGSGLSQAQYIRILDDGDGSAVVPNAGFDLDAIQATDVVPVELVSFTAENSDDEVVLKWQTATETNNSGFEIQRSRKSKVKSQTDWISITFMDGIGTTTERTDYIYKDKVKESGIYYYRLKQIDFDGSFGYSQTVEVNISSPKDFVLYQNYPNPFNPSTTIKFSLPIKGNIKLEVYNSVGQLIETILDKPMEAGYHELDFDGSGYSSGIYFYRLATETYSSAKKFILLK
jgi:hypothetical protein